MSNASDIASLVENSILGSLEPRFMKNDDGREFLVLPPNAASEHSNWTSEEITLDNKLEVLAPKIITQAVKVQEVASLMNYVNRFKNGDSALFADIASSTILGVIDYHTAANRPDDGDPSHGTPPTAVPEARHTKHTVSLQIPHSIEWDTWKKIDGSLMSHVEFSNFLEENQMDILPLGTMHDRAGEVIEDAPTTILELCRELQVKSGYKASGDIRNGDYISLEMMKDDDVTTKKNVQLPVSIDLNIPVYFGEQSVHITAFLRRKVIEGSIKLGVKLQRPEQVRQDEFKRIVAEIEQGVMLATLYGKPA
jgi:uncharacterized protein YfdQ (DUF2303 family)